MAETPEQVEAISKFFHEGTKALIVKHSYKLVGRKQGASDVVKDVFRTVPTQWVATQAACEMPASGFFVTDRNPPTSQASVTLRKHEGDTEETLTEVEIFNALGDIDIFCSWASKVIRF